MKRLVCMLLALVMTLSMLPVTAMQTHATLLETPIESVEGICGDNLTWVLEEGILTISGEGAIPSYNVASDTPWYEYRDSITALVIEDGITTVGDTAFMSMLQLTAAELADSVTSIGNYAFADCNALESIDLGTGVKGIGNGAFYMCYSLPQITLPDSLRGIGEVAFSNCSSLQTLNIPSGVTTIGDGAFRYCSGLKEIFFTGDAPAMGNTTFQSVKATVCYPAAKDNWENVVGNNYGGTLTWEAYTVENEATSGTCGDNLTWVLEDGVLTISGEGPMDDYMGGEDPWASVQNNITSIVVEEGVTHIGTYAFHYTPNLTSVELPESLDSIGECAFGMNYSLSEINLPEGLRTIGAGAFEDCASLTSVTIPASVTTIGNMAFNFCSGLSEVRFMGDAPAFGELVFQTMTATVYYPEGNATWTSDVMQQYGGEITWVAYEAVEDVFDSGTCGDNLTWELSCGVLTISGTGPMDDFTLWQQPWAEYAEDISSVCILEGVTTVGDYAFHGFGLSYAFLPQSLTSIGRNAFYGCGLKEIQIPYGVTSIGHSAFYGTGLTSVVVPGSVEAIGTYAFGCCSDLTDVELQPGIQTIGKFAFEACESLYWITIPNTVTQILDGAFGYCFSLEEITFGKTAPSIADDAFAGVTATIYYPPDYPAWDALIGKNFGGQLTWSCLGASAPTSGQCGDNVYWTLDVNTGVLTVTGTGAMWDNEQDDAWWLTNPNLVTSVVIEEGVTTVGYMAFADHGNITSVRFPTTLTTIAPGAFNGCPIENVNIPSGVTEIGDYAFWCVPNSKLKTVFVSGSPSIGANAFGGAEADMITFTGDAPNFNSDAFYGTTAYIAYPANNATWTDLIGQHFGGTLIWCGDGVKPSRLGPVGIIVELASGIFGECKWVLYNDGKLVISSASDLPAYMAFDGAPWYEYRLQICEVVIGDHVTGIENGNFRDLPLVDRIIFSEYVNHISSDAFAGATRNLCDIFFQGDAPDISEDAFTGVTVTVYYDSTKAGWENVAGKDYNGDLIWKEADVARPDGETLIDSGECGDNALWWLTKAGTLTVAGTGPMEDYHDNTYEPWYKHRDKITSIRIQEGISSIGQYAFGYLKNVTGVTIPDTVSQIGHHAFYYCSGLTEIHIPDSIFYIGHFAFGDCRKLRTIVLSDNLTNIGVAAFFRCYALTDICIPDSVAKIGGMAFDGTALTEVVIPNSVTEMNGAFMNCSTLERITLSNNLTALDEEEFKGCVSLQTITIPDSVTTIGDRAFAECSSLMSIAIPENVIEIGKYAFEGCTNLSVIEVDENNANYASVDGVLYDKAVTQLITCPAGYVDRCTVPSSVTHIQDWAFMDCWNLSGIFFEGDAPTFGYDVFSGVTTSAHYPADNETWTKAVRKQYGGTIKWKTTDEASDPPVDRSKCGDHAAWVLEDGVLTVSGTGDMYDYTYGRQPWRIHKNQITSVVIEDGITSIGDWAFGDCTKLAEITIGSSVVSIGGSAFYNCTGLTDIIVPDSVKTIYDGAFWDCSNLISVILGNGLTKIKSNAFFGCRKLTEIVIPDNVTSIGEGAFESCNQLSKVIIGKKVTSIDDIAFRECSNLTEVIFRGKAPSFGKSVFYGVTATVHYPTDRSGWRDVVGKNYGGSLTWVPYCSHYDAARVNAIAATCTEEGYTGELVCPDCDLTVAAGEMIPAKGHSFGDWYVEVRNRYMENGEEHRDCKNCNHYESRVLEFTFTLDQVQNVRATSKKTSVKLSYDKVAGADRYEIWVDGEYVSSTTSTSYTVEDLTQGVNYEFMVVARDSEDGNYLYGPGSQIVVARPYYELGNGYKLSLSDSEMIYDGEAKTPEAMVKKDSSGKHDVTEGVDYTVTYENNTDIGTATVTVTGIGKYGGTITKSFEILPDQVQNVNVEVVSEDTLQLTFDPVLGATEYWIYRSGSRIAKIPETSYTVTGLSAGKSYKLSVKANTVVDGDNYTGEESQSDSGKPVYRLEDCTVTVKYATRAHTGSSRTNTFTIKNPNGKTLTKDTDYTVSYENNKNVGTATATITGKGKYAGVQTVTFDIVPDQVSKPKAVMEQFENGSAVYVTFKSVAQADWFEIYLNGELYNSTGELGYYTEYLEPGSYSVAVRAVSYIDGKEYYGELSDAVKITVRKSVEYCTADLSEYEFVYTGKSHKPAVTVYGYDGEVLTEDVDYTISYKNNKSTGRGYVEVKGKGNYNGTLKEYFTIQPAQVTGLKVSSTTKTSVKISFDKDSTNSTKYYNVYVNGQYDGRTTGSSYTIKDLELGKTYSVYVVGEKTVSGVTYQGYESDPITVWPGTGIGGYKVTLDFTKATYTGEALCPGVVVKTSSKSSAKTLVAGEDYEVIYENNVGPGKAKVIIRGIGVYTGTITKTFTINPPKATNVTATALSKSQIEVSFDAAPGATSYWVYVNGEREAKITDTTCVITGLKKNKTYKITVKSVTAVDGTNYTSSATDSVSCKTLSE